jgi:hypothetical protein
VRFSASFPPLFERLIIKFVYIKCFILNIYHMFLIIKFIIRQSQATTGDRKQSFSSPALRRRLLALSLVVDRGGLQDAEEATPQSLFWTH